MELDNAKLLNTKNKVGLVLNGGGTCGVAHLGALARLNELNIKLDQFKYFAGTSVGSVITSALACGASVEYTQNVLNNINFNSFKDDDWGVARDLWRLWKKCGWYKGKYLEKWAYDTLGAVSGNPAITFQEIYERYGNYLVIPVMKNFETTIYYDRFRTPDMPVFKAVRRSSGIPLFWQADTDTNVDSDDDSDEEGDNEYDMYVDGGVLDNYPFHCLEKFLETDQILGLKLMSSKQLYELGTGKVKTAPPKNVLEAATKAIAALRSQALRLHIEEHHWVNTVKIDCKDMTSTEFDMTQEDKDWLFNQGKIAVDHFLSKKIT